ncbi:Uncharacterised protein [Xylophilus ampelinus]|nr:Uncharacterised protein [Xylophilus ampelinus]
MQHSQTTTALLQQKTDETAMFSRKFSAKYLKERRNSVVSITGSSQATAGEASPDTLPFLEAVRAQLSDGRAPPYAREVGLPTICVLSNAEAVLERLVSEITALLSTGVSASDIAVICGSQANSRLVSRRLISNRIAAIPVTHSAYAKDLRRVIWMTYFSSQLQAGKALEPTDEANKEKLEVALGPAQWAAVVKELRAIRTTSLESRYCACAEAYLRAKGGVRAKANQLLRSYLMTWEPICRRLTCPRQLLKLSRATAQVQCLTPQAAAGASWRFVFVAGMTEGVWKARKRQNDEDTFDLLVKVFAAFSEKLVIVTLPPTRPCILSAILAVAPLASDQPAFTTSGEG